MTIEEALRKASVMLAETASRPRLEAETLLAHLLGCERVRLHLNSSEELIEYEQFFGLVKRRAAAEPVEYITGKVSFYDTELEVGPGVLIARPETELLVDRCAEVIEAEHLSRIAEIGVGSGAVSIVLARKFPNLHITATDISADALDYAKRNIERYGLAERIELVECSLLEGVDANVEMIVSNPPYIGEDYELPAPLHYEPEKALVGGKRGDELLREIIDTANERKAAHLLCEMGYDQRDSILEYCRRLSLPAPQFYKDLAGFDRGFHLNLTGNERTT